MAEEDDIAAVAPGTPVTVTLADQTLTGLVQPGATAEPDGADSR